MKHDQFYCGKIHIKHKYNYQLYNEAYIQDTVEKKKSSAIELKSGKRFLPIHMRIPFFPHRHQFSDYDYIIQKYDC